MNTQFQTISQSELDDFERSCQRKQLKATDFDLKETNIVKTPTTGGLFHTNGTLIITKLPNGKSKNYQTGNGTHWAADFDGDLTNGFFN